MFPMVDMMQCQNLAVPLDVMRHVVQVESAANPYAIGVVGGKLVRQPRSLQEAIATAEMLETRGYNFSVGLAQVNRYNLAKYGVMSYRQAFDGCNNLQAGSRILAECHGRAGGDWGSAFSCYYSGNFVTGFQHGYVQRVFASMKRSSRSLAGDVAPLALAPQSQSRRSDGKHLDRLGSRGFSQTAGMETADRDPLWAESSEPHPQLAGDQHGLPPRYPAKGVGTQLADSFRAPEGNASAPSAGIVRLTRSGPVYPGQASAGSAAAQNENGSEPGVVAVTQVAADPVDNAFVF